MSFSLSIPVRPPYPWDAILRYLTPRSTPGVESISETRYVRQTPGGTVSVEFVSSNCSLAVSGDGALPAITSRLERLFDTTHDPTPMDRLLAASPILRPRIERLPGVRVPGCWEPFELCVRVILGQQVTVRAANTLMCKLVARCPGLDPAELAASDLSNFGMPGRRLETLRTLAEQVALGHVRLNHTWPEVAGQLAEIPGFGPWTLQYLAIRLGRDPDAFPAQDLGLLRASGVKSARELEKLAESWRPYRGYAAMYLWMAG